MEAGVKLATSFVRKSRSDFSRAKTPFFSSLDRLKSDLLEEFRRIAGHQPTIRHDPMGKYPLARSWKA
jgi:hypothetical protein